MKFTNTRISHALGEARRTALLVFCSVFFIHAGFGIVASASGETASTNWSVTSHQGKQIHGSSLVGKVTILNFWATYCIPCIVEFPAFHDLKQKYQKQGLEVVGVSVDTTSPAMLKAFVDKFKINYPVALSNPGVMNSFGVSDTVPMTFVIDSQGKIVRRYVGYVKKEELEKEIRPLLKL